jgi:hypothetical protein
MIAVVQFRLQATFAAGIFEGIYQNQSPSFC